MIVADQKGGMNLQGQEKQDFSSWCQFLKNMIRTHIRLKLQDPGQMYLHSCVSSFVVKEVCRCLCLLM